MTPSHRCRSNRDCLRLLAAVLALVCGVPETAISVPFTHSTPTGTSSGSPTNDLRTTLSFEPLQHYGYQPVTLSIQAVKPVARDRQITVRVFADRRFNGTTTRYDQAVEQDGELPAGAASLKVQMLIPKLHDWGIVHWEVWVDGRLDTELSGWAPQQNAGVQGPIDILKPVDSQQQPDLLGLARMLSTPWSRGQPNGFIEASATPLPHDWRALEGYHAVVLPFAELRAQAATNPAGMKALRKWVALGGRLLVEDVGQEFQRLADLDSFLGQHSYPFDRELARDQQPDKPPKAGEEEEQVDVVVKPPPFPATPSWKWAQLMLPRPRDLDEAEESDNSEGRRARESVDGWFLEAPLGFGAVAAFPESLQDVPDFRSEGELAERFSSYETRWLQRAVVGYLARWDWTERHGLTPDRGNEEFSNWLVPGVGAAPVDAFRLLITLFVLLVGPASFFVLRAYHRTQLMALTAPLAAAAFTLCLFAYATFSDGVGLRVRARSLTLLNQDTGEAVSWSRQSYYAGLAPAEGLTFPVGSAVYPIKAAWEVTDVNDSKHYMRELMIEAEAERYSQGWLASRQTSQMLVLDSEETSARLEFGGPADQPRVTNKLGADINHLFVLDHQANWWSASGVGQGETQPLDSQNRASIVAATRTAFLEAAPTYPPGIDGATPRGSINPFDLRRSRDRFGRLSGASLVDGQLERLLSQIEGRGDGLTTPLRPGAYVAITSRSVCAPLGHADARELGSFHVTLGVWEAAAL